MRAQDWLWVGLLVATFILSIIFGNAADQANGKGTEGTSMCSRCRIVELAIGVALKELLVEGVEVSSAAIVAQRAGDILQECARLTPDTVAVAQASHGGPQGPHTGPGTLQ